MKNRKLQKISSFFLIGLISTSLAIFTLHSHYHIHWDQTANQNQAHHSLSVDTVLCPICAHVLNSPSVPSLSGESDFQVAEIIFVQPENSIIDTFSSFEKGRSPPFSS